MCRAIASNRVSCRRSLHQRVVSSHQPECFVVAHYINVSCRHNNVWCDDTTRWCNERRYNTLFDAMTRHVDVMIDDTTLFDVMMRHVDVMIDDTTLCLMWVSSYQTECRFVVQYINVSCHHIKQCCVVAHYIKVSCHHIKQCCVVAYYIRVSCPHIKQSVVSSFITSKCRVITSTRVLYRRSLHPRIVSSHQPECHDTLM
jgi:hypothetical protein